MSQYSHTKIFHHHSITTSNTVKCYLSLLKIGKNGNEECMAVVVLPLRLKKTQSIFKVQNMDNPFLNLISIHFKMLLIRIQIQFIVDQKPILQILL